MTDSPREDVKVLVLRGRRKPQACRRYNRLRRLMGSGRTEPLWILIWSTIRLAARETRRRVSKVSRNALAPTMSAKISG